MKRAKIVLLILATLLAVPSVFAATSYSSAFRQQVIGYIGQELVPSVELDTSVLPFDIESSVVALNPSTSVVNGLRIGTYSIRANSNFNLTITHDNLTCTNPTQGTNLTTTIDYRLDVFCVDNTKNPPANKFKSCTASGTNLIPSTSISIGPDDVTKIGQAPNYIYLITNFSLYVSMVNDAAYLAEIEPGIYSSTITFILTAGS
ncbi:MAG: hypothetical protein IKP61_10730 [Spirochaetales bacterium]|nr:hypothetical protein [Spirochaetales bacterium]